jgi:trigger factor
MQIALNNAGSNSGILELILSKEDYKGKFESELNKHRNKAQIKGFRKGKAPVGMIKKLYGRSVLLEVVNQEIQTNISAFLEEKALDIIGSPLPAEDQVEYDFDPDSSDVMVFKFEIGWFPSIDLKGLSNEDVYTKLKVEVSDSDIDKEVEHLLKRGGTLEEVDGEVKENDIIEISAAELENGKLKEGGHKCTFKVRPADTKDEETRNLLLGNKMNTKFIFNVFKLESADPGLIRKHILGIDDESLELNETFEGEITQIKRLKPAELTEEFISEVFGGEITNEQDARNEIKKFLESQYLPGEDALLFRDIQERLLRENEIELPVNFIKKLVIQNGGEEKEISDKSIADFINSLKWGYIRDFVIKKHDLQVTNQEIYDSFKAQIHSYMRGTPVDEGFVNDMINRMASNKEAVQRQYDEVLTDKVFLAIKNDVKIEDKSVSKEAYDKMLEEARNAANSSDLSMEDKAE